MSTEQSERSAVRRRKRQGFPAFVCALLSGVAVVSMPFIARHISSSADEFSTRTFPMLPALGWLVCASLAAVVVTHRLQIWFKVDEGSVLAIAYDLLPLVLFAAPVIAIVAGLTGHLLLAAAGAALTVYHGVLVIPRLIREPLPAWALTAPRLQLGVANVYVDNATPEAAARQLTECGAAVVLIAEATPAFMRIFDSVGGDTSHPHRVWDPADTSDYAVAIASSLPLGSGSAIRSLGALRVAVAEVDVGGVFTTIVGLNPRATFDSDGQEIWKEQIEELKSYVPTVAGPLVVAGDFNSTEFRPEFEELLQIGLDDAIDALGQAWKPSFSLKSVGPVGGLALIARLDQALVNQHLCALSVQNLQACGSDHRPFLMTLAVHAWNPPLDA
jgi:endonuclease/exonuclease/phosphatase (EEP) superfamily protein YafD